MSNLLEVVLTQSVDEQAQIKSCVQVCIKTQQLENPQHKWIYCKYPVSQICSCNVEDPFSDNPQHRVHMRKDLCKPTLTQIYKCEQCGKTSKSMEVMKCHMETKHTKYACEDCNSKYYELQKFDEHIKVHKELGTKWKKVSEELFNSRPEIEDYQWIYLRKKQKLCELEIDEDTQDIVAFDDSYEDATFSPSNEDELEPEDEEIYEEEEKTKMWALSLWSLLGSQIKNSLGNETQNREKKEADWNCEQVQKGTMQHLQQNL